jgi:hypothetical protein
MRLDFISAFEQQTLCWKDVLGQHDSFEGHVTQANFVLGFNVAS